MPYFTEAEAKHENRINEIEGLEEATAAKLANCLVVKINKNKVKKIFPTNYNCLNYGCEKQIFRKDDT